MYFIEHPKDSSLQLTDDEQNLLIFSTVALAEARRDKFGQGGNIIGPKTSEDIWRRFGTCRTITLVTESGENVMTACGLELSNK